MDVTGTKSKSKSCRGILKRSSYKMSMASTEATTSPLLSGGTRDKSTTTRSSRKENRSEPRSSTFLSVLSQPFPPWNELEITIGEFCPEWSHVHRSYIVQHLVRFLECKVVTEEFSPTKKLLAPTPLIAQAWQALIVDALLYQRVLYEIQDFHERPHAMLKHSLQRKDRQLKAGTTNAKRLERTQHLFEAYYGERMLISVQDVLDTDTTSFTDTSTITEVIGIWNLPVPKCAGAVGNSLESSTCRAAGTIGSRSGADGSKNSTFQNMKSPAWWSKHLCLDAVGDILFFSKDEEDDRKCAAADSSNGCTVLLEDILEESSPIVETVTTTGTATTAKDGTVGETENDDSLFTFDFFRTRHFLCRPGGVGTGTVSSCGSGNCPPAVAPLRCQSPSLRYFSW